MPKKCTDSSPAKCNRSLENDGPSDSDETTKQLTPAQLDFARALGSLLSQRWNRLQNPSNDRPSP
jgi:hypothetical protein